MIAFLCIVSFLFGQKKSRPFRYSLDDLTNPTSPSYVPYPFPKQDFEISEDFKYGIRKMRLYEKPGYDIFLFEKKGVYVDKIVKVKQKCLNYPHEYYYLLQIRQDGEIVGVHAVDEFGLLGGGVLLETHEQKKAMKPLKNNKDVMELLEKTLSGIKIKKIEFVYRISDICRLLAPMWEVETEAGIYFVDHNDSIWYVQSEIAVSDEKIRARKGKAVLDEESGKLKFLKKVS